VSSEQSAGPSDFRGKLSRDARTQKLTWAKEALIGKQALGKQLFG
jgi:hypothetical protein